MTTGPKARPIAERFWAKVEKAEGCWLWTGATQRRGYGAMSQAFGKAPLQAHRVSWELHFGPIPEGLCVLHRCDVPACVKPEHLFLGTRKDNAADMIAKGRSKLARGLAGPANGRWIDGRRSTSRSGP